MKDAESKILVREPDAGEPPVRFDERAVETARTAPPLDSTQVMLRRRKLERGLRWASRSVLGVSRTRLRSNHSHALPPPN